MNTYLRRAAPFALAALSIALVVPQGAAFAQNDGAPSTRARQRPCRGFR